jgi:hypothetical protein
MKVQGAASSWRIFSLLAGSGTGPPGIGQVMPVTGAVLARAATAARRQG